MNQPGGARMSESRIENLGQRALLHDAEHPSKLLTRRYAHHPCSHRKCRPVHDMRILAKDNCHATNFAEQWFAPLSVK
jgi:hypothetical protein